MSGPGISLYTDEDVDPELAVQLRRHGYDAISCREAENHNQGLSDEWQLTWAANEGRPILVFNVRHYGQLDHAWKAAHRTHAGIIMAQHEWVFSEPLRRTVRHLTVFLDPDPPSCHCECPRCGHHWRQPPRTS
jgi:hypothetical protein